MLQVMLAKLYIEILGLGQGSPAAEKLKNFRGPKNNKSVSSVSIQFFVVDFVYIRIICYICRTWEILQIQLSGF